MASHPCDDTRQGASEDVSAVDVGVLRRSAPFGAGPVALERPAGVLTGSADLAEVTAAFHAFDGAGGAGGSGGSGGSGGPPRRLVRVARCGPTAAFSRRDTLLPGYAAARAGCLERGFEPVVRPVGGHLAAYDEGSLVFYLGGAHDDARTGIDARFARVGEAVRDALAGLGVPDVRVGAVPGEYCDGRYSVNAGGVSKLVGTGQRLRRRAYLLCGVVSVLPSPAVVDVLTAAYAALGLPLDPATVGCVADVAPVGGLHVVEAALLTALQTVVGPG